MNQKVSVQAEKNPLILLFYSDVIKIKILILLDTHSSTVTFLN